MSSENKRSIKILWVKKNLHLLKKSAMQKHWYLAFGKFFSISNIAQSSK